MQNENKKWPTSASSSTSNFFNQFNLQTVKKKFMSSVVPPSRRNLLLRAIRFFERIINAACILAYQFFATLSQENKLIFLSLSFALYFSRAPSFFPSFL